MVYYGPVTRTVNTRRRYARRNKYVRKRAVSTRTVKLTVPRVRRIMTNIAEKKYKDDAVSDNTITTGWEFVETMIAGIEQGTTASTRIGNRIMLEKITVSVTVYANSSTPLVAGATTRVILYHDAACNGRPVTWDDLFNSNSFNSIRNSPYSPTISILRDRYVEHHCTATDGTVQHFVGPQTFQWVVRPRKVIDFVGNNKSLSDILKHTYGVGFCSSSNNYQYLTIRWKIEFTDI